MHIPEHIDHAFFAPCGVNCFFCYAHVRNKKPCPGCLVDAKNKTARCLNCRIKKCAESKGVTLCADCDDFPCKTIKNLNKSYTTRYNINLIENSRIVKEKGLDHFFALESKKWRCPKCKGAIDMHYKKCSNCFLPL